MKNLIISTCLLILASCVSTSSHMIKSDIYSYDYNDNSNIIGKQRVTALKTVISYSDTGKKVTGLTLVYKTDDNDRHVLLIESDYINGFRNLLKQQSAITPKDSGNRLKFNLGRNQVDVVTLFAHDKRIIFIGSLAGTFAFHENDVKDILRLLDKIQATPSP